MTLIPISAYKNITISDYAPNRLHCYTLLYSNDNEVNRSIRKTICFWPTLYLRFLENLCWNIARRTFVRQQRPCFGWQNWRTIANEIFLDRFPEEPATCFTTV